MPRYKLTVEYHGALYAGWQRQIGQLGVQEVLEKAVFQFCQHETQVIGAGRTDAGVHAIAQIAHVDLPHEYEPFTIMQGINFYLFDAQNSNRISVIGAEAVSDDFSARFSAIRRHYLYRIINRRSRLGLEAGRAWHVVEPLDEMRMQEAANLLIGHHDFSSFRDTQCQAKSPEKTLEQLDILRDGDELRIVTSARSFLHHQVRIMVGTLALVGKGKWSVDDMAKALKARDRSAAGPTAPPDGLYLTKVDY